MSSHPQNSARSALLEERARVMRAPTLSEARLWSQLAGRRLGVAFRRQVVIGQYIVDFLAPAPRLVVEVDGAYHARRSRVDARRDARLKVLGYRVLRLEAELVMRELAVALEHIEVALRGGGRWSNSGPGHAVPCKRFQRTAAAGGVPRAGDVTSVSSGRAHI